MVIIIAIFLKQSYEVIGTIILPILHIWKYKEIGETSSSRKRRVKSLLIAFSVSGTVPGKVAMNTDDHTLETWV